METTNIDELRRQLIEAQRRAEEAEQQRKQEQQRADEEQQRAEEAQQRAEEAEQETRSTTLSEYLEASHSLVFTNFAVQTDKRLTSKGSMTDPRNKWCPARLSPWEKFLEEQRTTLGALVSAFPADARAFESRGFLKGLGRRVSRSKIANEKDLELFQHISVEDPVRSIFERLAGELAVKHEFDIGSGIFFENHPNAMSDRAEEVAERQAGQVPNTPARARLNGGQLRPDQICVYRRGEGNQELRGMVYVAEYKAPHKLTLPHLRIGLRPMDIRSEVIHRVTKPAAADEEALFQYHADKLVAAAVSQTFHYMIEGGLEYGLLTTGEAIVFLKINWDDPNILYYHLAEPGSEVQAHPDASRYCTAVAQVLAFSLMALGPPGQSQEHTQDDRQSAINSLYTWSEDYELILRAIPPSERTAPLTSPAYVPTTYGSVRRSPPVLRGGRNKRGARRCPNAEHSAKPRSPQTSDDESGSPMPDTPSPTLPRTRRQGKQSQGVAAVSHGDGGGGPASPGRKDEARRFCTQGCLLGLLKGGPLDRNCPNVVLHQRGGSDTQHLVGHNEWLQLLSKQLSRTLDKGIIALGKQGARGALFQVTLLGYGYSFVAKGTVPAFVEDLKHEEVVYRQLEDLQGVCVPVFLGAFDLRNLGRVYYYAHDVRIVYLMCLSWSGDELDDTVLTEAVRNRLLPEVTRSVRSLHAYGVVHGDVRGANVLWCPETGRAMMIDFERAQLMKKPRMPLVPAVPNKRARNADSSGATKSVNKASLKRDRLRQDDLDAAQLMFMRSSTACAQVRHMLEQRLSTSHHEDKTALEGRFGHP